ncbi:hypothetical protein R3P38DRAFT_10800 [Favolaschia claudopus]|uniref:F-box domain-containing protein n=1 Tax=Favolaschia claudopus TaxID=2862362 RepID=A0AAW0EHW1_9AGAR
MSLSRLRHDTLPTELWLEIFENLETYTIAHWHEPFQPIPGVTMEGDTRNAYRNIVLVCRDWHAWATNLLYRNVKMSSSMWAHGTDTHREHGHSVERAVLPYTATVTESPKYMPSTEVLSLYSNLKVLVRPLHRPSLFTSLRFDFDAMCPPLPSLKRLDWWNHAEASRSGGINSLTAVLAEAPNLEFLFVGVVRPNFTPFHGLGAARICLPSLRTLRLSMASALLLRHIVVRWTLPVLDHLVVDSPLAAGGMDMIWEVLGAQLSVVEFGKHVRFLIEHHLTSCLRGCPNLREIYYYLFTTLPPHAESNEEETIYPSVTSIGIHMAEIPFLEDDQDEWEHMKQHFDAFTSGMFPNLRLLRVVGMQDQVRNDERFASMHQRLRDRNCVLEISE